jgi:hypothetical protein
LPAEPASVEANKPPGRGSSGRFQFNALRRDLVSDGIPYDLPYKLADVIEAMLKKDELNPKIRVWHLAHVDVAKIYYKGWLKDRFPRLTEEERTERFELYKGEIEKNPRRFSHQFGRGLRQIFRDSPIAPKLVCHYDRRNKCYRLGDGWNVKRPLLSKLAARLAYTGRNLYLPCPAARKTPVRGSETGEDDEPKD